MKRPIGTSECGQNVKRTKIRGARFAQCCREVTTHFREVASAPPYETDPNVVGNRQFISLPHKPGRTTSRAKRKSLSDLAPPISTSPDCTNFSSPVGAKRICVETYLIEFSRRFKRDGLRLRLTRNGSLRQPTLEIIGNESRILPLGIGISHPL